ncbi:hypothetical protein CSOJ01_13406 [Colletotrichum sojae]|uniref:Haloacid dehalogenase-like hydrolase n=1 Tax=Colletotrichum sojae TaxID=2175907 RepID=A0A8H6IT53_9PEZI|nr:hypothetical protein CSOJ01_13406 [Colletotrichum sojae]
MAAPRKDFDAVIFDLDCTLADGKYNSQQAMIAVQQALPHLRGLDSVYAAPYFHPPVRHFAEQIGQERFNRHLEDAHRLIQSFYSIFGLHAPNTQEVDISYHTWLAAYGQRGNRRATPSSIETLRRLRQRGIPVVILTNGAQQFQTHKAREIGVLEHVDELISSESVGSRKPSSRMFDAALERLGTQRHRTLMVGDCFQNDVIGVRKAGLGAVLYNPSSSSSGDHYGLYYIRNSSDVLPLCGIGAEEEELTENLGSLSLREEQE